MNQSFVRHLEKYVSEKIQDIKPLSGGDINDVYLLSTDQGNYVVKINSASSFPGMFTAEALGLQLLEKSNTFTIPKVISQDEYDDTSFLLLSYIKSTSPVKNFWKIFGEQLAQLHQITESYFGLEIDNYIGSLPQYNKKCSTASDFYISQRLEPQFALARQNGFSFSDLHSFYKNVEQEIPKEPSSLVHGDLWSGNFMVGADGRPCLIDPAVAHAPREMDIGMMHLFGGFDAELFNVYNDTFPMPGNWKARLPIWQLYYVLVHLNLFGSSYYGQAKQIVEKFL